MFKIVKDPAPSLRQPSEEVPLPLSEQDKAYIDEMFEYLKLTQDPDFLKKHPKIREGVGLAAPQTGRNVRMLVIYYANYDKDGNVKGYTQYELVNPKIVSSSVRKAYIDAGEGCLSVDQDHPGHVIRHFKVVVDAYDALVGKQVNIVARGYDAIVLQHEIDHLDGVLFYDRIDKADPFKEIPDAYVC